MCFNLAEDTLDAVRPRWFVYPTQQVGQDFAYDAEAEFCDAEEAGEELAEAYIKHNNARTKCNNLILDGTGTGRGCNVCWKEYQDYYFVWKLSLRMKRFE